MKLIDCRGIAAVVCFLVSPRLEGQVTAAVNARDTAREYIVGDKETVLIKIAFDRLARNDRGVLGDLVPYGTPWATGVDRPAEVTCPRPFLIGELKVPAGTSALWLLATRTNVMLIVSRTIGPGAGRYDSTADVGRVALRSDTLAVPVEPFAILFRNDRKAPDTLISQFDTRQSAAMHGEHYTIGMRPGAVQTLIITWDRFRWSVPVGLQ